MKTKSNARNCGRCGKPVKPESDYVRAYKWSQSAVFHWQCWLTVLSERDQATVRELCREVR
jgi:hypothetical protein